MKLADNIILRCLSIESVDGLIPDDAYIWISDKFDEDFHGEDTRFQIGIEELNDMIKADTAFVKECESSDDEDVQESLDNIHYATELIELMTENNIHFIIK